MGESETTTPENNEVKRKARYTGSVLKTTLAGALVDIGLEKPAVIHISQLQKEPVKRVEDVLTVGQEVDVWVRRVDKKNDRIELTMVEPLALEWREIKKGMVVKGTVTRLEKFGAFIEIGAERPGLAHISELTHEYIRTPGDFLKVGQEVDAKVLEVNRRKKQIKLSLKAMQEEPKPEKEEEEVVEVPAPTAMEVALRKAMGEDEAPAPEKKESGKSKASKSSVTMDDIVARTLKNKVKTE